MSEKRAFQLAVNKILNDEKTNHHCIATKCFYFIITSKGNICEIEAQNDKEKCIEKRYVM